MVLLQRMGDEQDMVGIVLYFVFCVGVYCNGVVMILDGGRFGNFFVLNQNIDLCGVEMIVYSKIYGNR